MSKTHNRLIGLGISLIAFVVGILFLFLYSYTQVDLNLTLSTISLAFGIQDFFQYIGYFMRPTSTAIYICIIILLFISYAGIMYYAYKKKLNKKILYLLTVFSGLLLLFSYPAFSYDIYNYMFDARIITKYAQNPYVHKALDYPDDPWIHFMRWTHRTYPYGPVWLLITAPLSFVGFSKFLPTLWLFKLLSVVSYAGSTYLIYKVMCKTKPESAVAAAVFFAFNPLTLVELTVSAHNESVMIFLMLCAIYLLIVKKQALSFLALGCSIGIKFITAVLLPVYLWYFYTLKRNKKIMWDRFFFLSLILLLFGSILVSIRTNFQPWYLIPVISIASFLNYKPYISIPIFIVTLAGLFQYVPFLYTGNWDYPIPVILNAIMLVAIIASSLFLLFYFIYKKYIYITK
jgi:hypothetical protein